MIVDPDGNPVIPHTGNAVIVSGTADGDPAKVGDCNRTLKPGVRP